MQRHVSSRIKRGLIVLVITMITPNKHQLQRARADRPCRAHICGSHLLELDVSIAESVACINAKGKRARAAKAWGGLRRAAT